MKSSKRLHRGLQRLNEFAEDTISPRAVYIARYQLMTEAPLAPARGTQLCYAPECSIATRGEARAARRCGVHGAPCPSLPCLKHSLTLGRRFVEWRYSNQSFIAKMAEGAPAAPLPRLKNNFGSCD